jgi:hypothetical protein
VVRAFNSPVYNTQAQLYELRDIALGNLKFGSAKVQSKDKRPKGEPDVVVKIPETDLPSFK